MSSFTVIRGGLLTSIDLLRTLNGEAGDVMCLSGSVVAGDGGGGVYFWEANVITGDDAPHIVVPNNPRGRWRRLVAAVADVPALLAKNILAYGAVRAEASALSSAAQAALNDAAIADAMEAATAGGTRSGAIYAPSGTFFVATTIEYIGAGEQLSIYGDGGGTQVGGTSFRWVGASGAGPVLELSGVWRGVCEKFDLDGNSLVETVAYVHSDQATMARTGAGFQGYVFRHIGVINANPDAADPVLFRVGESVGGTYQADLTTWESCVFLGSVTKPWNVTAWRNEQGGNTTTFRFRDCWATYCRFGVDAKNNSETLLVDSMLFTNVCGALLTVESVDAAANTITVTGHRLINGERVRVGSTVSVPGGLVAIDAAVDDRKTYWIVNRTANTLQLSESSGGAAVDITTAGSGVIKLHVLDSACVRGGTEGRIVMSGCNVQNGAPAGGTVGRIFSGTLMGSSGPGLNFRDNSIATDDTPDLHTGEWNGQLTMENNVFRGGVSNAATYTSRFMCAPLLVGGTPTGGAPPGAVASRNNRFGIPYNPDGTAMTEGDYAARGAYAPFYAFGGSGGRNEAALTGWEPSFGGAFSYYGKARTPVTSSGDHYVSADGKTYVCEPWDGNIARSFTAMIETIVADGARSAPVTVAWSPTGVLKAGTKIEAVYADLSGAVSYLPAGVTLECGRSGADEVWVRYVNNSGGPVTVAAGYVFFEASNSVRPYL